MGNELGFKMQKCSPRCIDCWGELYYTFTRECTPKENYNGCKIQ
nr:MAG TPA_asm: envelope glycoprotein [Caudoviricetes sp.]